MAMEQRRYRLPPFGSSAPLIPFASFPAALSADGQILRPAEVPRVELMASGGLWLPRGGRQVLQQRHNNPVKWQSVTEGVAETLGPFPGGLVRAGMSLELRINFLMGAIGTGTRKIIPRIGTPASIVWGIGFIQSATSNIGVNGEMVNRLWAQSDVSAGHPATPSSGSGSVSGLAAGYITNNVQNAATVDFSQPWSIGVAVNSADETATSITSVSWSGGVATFVNPSHTLNTGDKTTVAGVSVAGYNGVYSNITRIDANTWSGTLVANPGGAGTGGTSSRISNVIIQSYSLALEG